MSKKLIAMLVIVILTMTVCLTACGDVIDSTASNNSESTDPSESTKAPETTAPEQTSTPAPTTPEPTSPVDPNTHEHSYAWTDAVNDVSTYKCSCGDEKGSVNVSVSNRQLIDVDETNVVIDLAQFGSGLTVKSVTLGQITVTGSDLSVADNKLTIAADKLLGQTPVHGDSDATIAVAIGEGDSVNVKLPVRVAYTISTVEELKALYTVTDHENYSNPVVGGVVGEDGSVTRYYYVLTDDIDGSDNFGNGTEYGQNDESWYTSGSAKQGFVGVFDGQGHTIKGLKIVGHGIFGHIGCGTIQNVDFADIELADGDTALLGKVMDGTISNVKISNITVGDLSVNSGLLFYTQCFSASLSNVDIDMSDVDKSIYVFTKMLDAENMWEFDNTSFENVKVKLDSSKGNQLFESKKATDAVNGITVSFVPFTVAKPEANTGDFYYTGSELTYTLATSEYYTISGDRQTEEGVYTVTVSLLKNEGIKWVDGSTDDLTFTFEIKAFPTEMVTQTAETFVAKVTALGTPVYPRDNQKIAAVLADYEALNPLVKEHSTVVSAKITLDGYKTEADKWVDLGNQFAASVTLNALSGYDRYYLVIYNPTDEDASFYYAGAGGDWTARGQTTLTAKTWTQVELISSSATAGGAYCYVGSDHTKFTAEGSEWVLKIYGKQFESGTQQVALSVNGQTDAQIEGQSVKVLSVSVPKEQQYLEGFGRMTNEQLAALANGYDNIYVYVYNPLDEEVSFFLQDEKDWQGHCQTTLAANSWTKVNITLDWVAGLESNQGAYVDVSYKPADADSTGWMISDFYGTVK